MASSIVSSLGLGSGINITEIVKVLVDSDTAAKKAQITRQTSNNAAYISGVGALRSALTAFTTSMGKLNDKNAPSFNAYAATSASESVVKAKASNTAVAGSYSIEVKNLATSSKVASQAFLEGPSKSIDPGELVIEQGGKSYKITVGADATLQTVRDQINKELSASGISANIITGEDGARLVLGSTTTGAKTDINVTGIPDLAIDGTKSMKTNGAGYITAPAEDAVMLVDGLEVKSASNTVTTAVSGLSLELTGASVAGSPTKVTVASNTDGLKTSVQSFVDAYNTLQKTVAALTKATTNADGSVTLGPLSNDPTTRSLLADVRGVLAEVGAGDRLTTLSQLGINTQKDGTLEFTSSKFDSAMNDKKLGSEIQQLFSGTNGIFERMTKVIDPYNAVDGSLVTRKNNLDKVAKNLADQQAALDRRTEALTTSLTKKYVALDTALGKMKAQANQITSIFEAINAQARKS